MKKIALVVSTLVLAMVAGSALAANSLNKGSMGLNFNLQDDPANFIVNGKYLVTNDMAILGGLGLRVSGGDSKGTDLGLLAGIRKYLKTDDLAPFVGGRLVYSSTNDSNITKINLMAEAGAEYFLAKQFSVEGRIGFGYGSTENKTAVPTTKVTAIGTSVFGVSANFYF